MPVDEEKYRALLSDLQNLRNYLQDRGDKTRALSQKFTSNAQNDAANRDFDLNQARMLEYQTHIWHEIGNLVEKLIKQHE